MGEMGINDFTDPIHPFKTPSPLTRGPCPPSKPSFKQCFNKGQFERCKDRVRRRARPIKDFLDGAYRECRRLAEKRYQQCLDLICPHPYDPWHPDNLECEAVCDQVRDLAQWVCRVTVGAARRGVQAWEKAAIARCRRDATIEIPVDTTLSKGI